MTRHKYNDSAWVSADTTELIGRQALFVVNLEPRKMADGARAG